MRHLRNVDMKKTKTNNGIEFKDFGESQFVRSELRDKSVKQDDFELYNGTAIT